MTRISPSLDGQVTCRMLYGAISLDWDWTPVCPVQRCQWACTKYWSFLYQVPRPLWGQKDEGLTSSLNMNGSCPRWQLLWGRFGEGSPMLAGVPLIRGEWRLRTHPREEERWWWEVGPSQASGHMQLAPLPPWDAALSCWTSLTQHKIPRSNLISPSSGETSLLTRRTIYFFWALVSSAMKWK